MADGVKQSRYFRLGCIHKHTSRDAYREEAQKNHAGKRVELLFPPAVCVCVCMDGENNLGNSRTVGGRERPEVDY